METPAVMKMDVLGALAPACIPFILLCTFTDLFDTVGTLVGVSERAGFMRDGELPRASRALVSDALGTRVGAALGTSTVTSYIESAYPLSDPVIVRARRRLLLDAAGEAATAAQTSSPRRLRW